MKSESRTLKSDTIFVFFVFLWPFRLLHGVLHIVFEGGLKSCNGGWKFVKIKLRLKVSVVVDDDSQQLRRYQLYVIPFISSAGAAKVSVILSLMDNILKPPFSAGPLGHHSHNLTKYFEAIPGVPNIEEGELPILVVAAGPDVLLLNIGLANEEGQKRVIDLLYVGPPTAPNDSDNNETRVKWSQDDMLGGLERLEGIAHVDNTNNNFSMYEALAQSFGRSYQARGTGL